MRTWPQWMREWTALELVACLEACDRNIRHPRALTAQEILQIRKRHSQAWNELRRRGYVYEET